MPTKKISIPEPCHEKPNAMSFTEQGWFCTSCQKEVIDFTNMSDREVLETIRRNLGGCGTFLPTQLNRSLESPSEKKKWQAAAIAAGMLSLATPAIAQQNTETRVQTEIRQNQGKAVDSTAKNDCFTVRGIATDELGEPLKHIKVESSNGKTTKTNRRGEFKIKAQAGDTILFYYNRRIGATLKIISQITNVVPVTVKTTMHQISGRYF